MRAHEFVVAACAACLSAACSFANLDVTECETTARCRDDFGVGSICREDGYCELAEAQPRCKKTFPPDLLDDPVAAADRILVGNLMDRSSSTHQARENSAELAFSAANEQSGVAGRRFGVVFCTVEEASDIDSLTRGEAAVVSARYLVDVVGVPAIIGPAASSDTQAVFVELQRTEEDVLVISPSATSPALSELDPSEVSDAAPGLLWRTAPPDSLQSAAIVLDMRTPGMGRPQPVESVAVLFEAGAYGDALGLRFVQGFQAAGGTTTQLPFEGESQRNEQATVAGLSDVDEVVFISSQFTDAIAFLDAAAAVPSYDSKRIFLTDAAANRDVLARANTARFAQIRGTHPAPLDEANTVYANYLSSYAAQFGANARQFSFVANAYDAAWLVAYGAAWALAQEQQDGLSGTTIARGLRQMSAGDVVEILPSNWSTVLNRFSAGASINVQGASGSLDFDPETEETTGEIEVWQISGGMIEGLYSISP